MVSFKDLLAVNDRDIDTFVKDAHSVNNAKLYVQRTLVSNNVTQGIKPMFFELMDIVL